MSKRNARGKNEWTLVGKPTEVKNTRPKICGYCKEKDHLIKDCPILAKKVCTHCGVNGHTINHCDKPFICSYCGAEGHLVDYCEVLANLECKTCGRNGHQTEGCMLEPTYKMTSIFGSQEYPCDKCKRRFGYRMIEDIKTHLRINLCRRCMNTEKARHGMLISS